MIPMMKKKAMRRLLGSCYSAAAIQGVVMPRSYNMILYAIAAGGVSISSMFLAGIIPCLILLTALLITSYVIAEKEKVCSRRTSKA